MKKRLLTVLMAAVMAGTMLLSGCGKEPAKETEDGKKVVKFMGWGTDAEISTFEKMIEEFEKKNTDIKVEYTTVPSGDFDTKLQNMIAAGEQPDVFYCPIDSFAKYVATGNLLDITSYVEDNNLESNIWQNAVDIYRYDGETTGQGAIYALPKDVSAFPIVYNKDLFKAAGITPPTEEKPWDWNDYREAAIKLTDGDVYGTAMYSLESAVWSNGGDWLDESLTKVEFNDPKFTEALQFVADLRFKDKAAPSSAEETSLSSYDRFMQGKLGMMGAGSWAIADFWNNCDFEWDIMDWPVNPNTGEKAIWFGSAGLAVSPKSEYKEEACKLVSYLALDEETQRIGYEDGQAVPTLIDMANGEYMEFDKDPVNKKAFINILSDYGRLATQSKTFNQEWWTEFNAGIDEVYDGKVTAQEYCDAQQEKAQELLDKSVEQQKALQNK